MSTKSPTANAATQKQSEQATARVTPIDRSLQGKDAKAAPPPVEPIQFNPARIASKDSPDGDLLVARFLRSLQVQLRSIGLYERNHPRLTDNLELAEHDLRAAFSRFPGFGIRVEDGILCLTTRLAEMPWAASGGLPNSAATRSPFAQSSAADHAASGRTLADTRGTLRALAKKLNSAGITSLIFLPQTNSGELASLAQAVDAACRERKRTETGSAFATRDWMAWAAAQKITGIRVNSASGRSQDAVLASLLGALLARDTTTSASHTDPIRDCTREQVQRTMHFLSVAGTRLDQAQRGSAEDAARAVQAELASADSRALELTVRRAVDRPPRGGDSPGVYLSRIGDELAAEFVRREFMSERITGAEIRLLFEQLYRDKQRGDEEEIAFESRIERFWAAMPARGIARTLRSQDAWCVPVSALRHHLEPLLSADATRGAEASGRTARRAIGNYVGCLNSEEAKARRTVAAALVELSDVLERVWPHPQLEDLAPGVVAALVRESSPSIAGLLVAATENLARVGVARHGYAEIEGILKNLDEAPRDAEHGHIEALAHRIVAQEQWLTMVDASLANRPLDAALPRLLSREPQRLVDRLGFLLAGPGGVNALPTVARLVRAAGEPVIGTLDAQLREPRHQRVATAIKLLSAVQPQRLAAALPRVLPAWDWSLQDLAVSELSHQPSAELRKQAAKVFLSILAEAHLFVVSSMLDQIALAGETAGVPQLWAIAAGDVEQLHDIFIRIKAVEALGRLRATEAADLLRNMVRQREGLTHAEPEGLRAAATEALALIENDPGSAGLQTAHEAANKMSGAFTVPRRYMRVALPTPLPAKIAAPHEGMAKVSCLALGGALLETATALAVGDSIRVEIRVGLRRISSTAVVRSARISGYGIEFMHMKSEDRERLRRYLCKLL